MLSQKERTVDMLHLSHNIATLESGMELPHPFSSNIPLLRGDDEIEKAVIVELVAKRWHWPGMNIAYTRRPRQFIAGIKLDTLTEPSEA